MILFPFIFGKILLSSFRSPTIGTIDESYVPILKGVYNTSIVFEQGACWCHFWFSVERTISMDAKTPPVAPTSKPTRNNSRGRSPPINRMVNRYMKSAMTPGAGTPDSVKQNIRDASVTRSQPTGQPVGTAGTTARESSGKLKRSRSNPHTARIFRKIHENLVILKQFRRF